MSIIKCALQAGELEFGNVGSYGGKFIRTNRRTRRKTLGARTRTNNKLNPRMTQGPRIEPGPHWWQASALTTAPFLFLFFMPKFTKISSTLLAVQ